MSFLAPLFFAALAAIGVPVLLHMIQRQRTEVVEFPSLMFVKKIPFHSLRRQRIRHWLLLLLRCAALALLVAAFARPFFESAALVAATGGSSEVVILVDRSYSMGFDNRWSGPAMRRARWSKGWRRTTRRPSSSSTAALRPRTGPRPTALASSPPSTALS